MSAQQSVFTLGLDLDGVCGDYISAFRGYVARYTGVDAHEIPEPLSWDLASSGWPIDSDEHFSQLHADAVRDGLFRSLPPFPGVSQALWRLSDAGVQIRVITHRLFVKGLHSTTAADTVMWLDRHDIPYRDLCFVARKAQVDADVYIDDAPHNIEALRSSGKRVIVFDAPYNREVAGPRAHDWDEAFELITQEYQRFGVSG